MRENEEIKQVEIIPERLLSDETTKKLLEKFKCIEGIKNVVVQGPQYYRRIIKIDDERYEISVKVGKVFLDVKDETTIGSIIKVCDEVFSFGYSINYERLKRKPTLSEQLGKKIIRRIGRL